LHGPSALYYLNPIHAGLSTCIHVHEKKASALLGDSFVPLFRGTLPTEISTALRHIEEDANRYQKRLLEESIPFRVYIEQLVTTWHRQMVKETVHSTDTVTIN
jgi:hypothetical protein